MKNMNLYYLGFYCIALITTGVLTYFGKVPSEVFVGILGVTIGLPVQLPGNTATSKIIE